MIAFVIPASGQIHLALGLALLAWFGFYLYKVSHGDVEEPDLIGTAAALGELPDLGGASPSSASSWCRVW